MTRRSMLAAALATAVFSIAALPAVAQPPPADDRAAAREFSYAAYRLRVAVKATVPEIDRRLAAVDCFDELDSFPDRVEDELADLVAAAYVDALIGPSVPAFERFVAELARVPVADPALRSGRAAWRRRAADLAALAPVPADLCAQIARWRKAGYARSARPALDTGPIERLAEADTRDRKLAAAARRLRELGVARGTAERFTGDAIFEGLIEESELGEEDEET